MSRPRVSSLVAALLLGIGLLGVMAPGAFSHTSHADHASHRHSSSRPPGRVAGLRVLSQGSSSVRIGWRRARRGSISIGGYRIKRDGLVVGQTHGRTYTLWVGTGAHRITITAVDLAGRLGPASRPLSIDVPAPPALSKMAPSTPSTPNAPSTPSAPHVPRVAPPIPHTTPTPPSAPSGLKAVEVGYGSAVVEWGASTPASGEAVGYRVFRDGTTVGQTSGLDMTLEHLAPETGYTITVVAVDSLGATSASSAPLEIETASLIAPSAPSGLRAVEVGYGSAVVAWGASMPVSGEVVGYRVFRDGVSLGQTSGLDMTLEHLAPETGYTITVVAVDSFGATSVSSAPLEIETASVAPPSAPSGLRAVEVGYGSAVVAWDASTAVSGEVVGYRVFRDGVSLGQTSGLDMTLEHLAPETGYTITVVAVDSLGATSAPSAPLEIKTVPPTPPSTPSGLKASQVGDESAVLEWEASTPGSGEVVGYRVFRNGTPVSQTSSLGMTLASLAPETGYMITVVAVDSFGATSEPSPPLEIKTQPPPQTHGTAQAALLATTTLSFDDLQAHYQQIGVLYPTYFECGTGGAVTGNNDPLVTSWSEERGIAVMPRLNCQNPLVEDQILNEPAVQQKLIEALASLSETYGYAGIQVDYEGAQPTERQPFTAFIKALAEKLHKQGEKLSTIVTAKTYNIPSGRAAMYDDEALSRIADYLFVLDWGKHWTTSAPGGIDELPWFKEVAEYTAKVAESTATKSKFVLGMPMYGIDWPNAGGSSNPGTPLEFSEITALASEFGVLGEWEPVAADPHFSYVDHNGVPHSVWYTDKQSLEARVELAKTLGLGVGLWHLGSEDQSIWELPGLGGGG
jgi:spore germination protein YaaH